MSHRWIILKKPFGVVEVRQLANSLTKKWRSEREAQAHLQQMEEKVRDRTPELQAANELLHAEIERRAEAEETLWLHQQALIRQLLAFSRTYSVRKTTRFGVPRVAAERDAGSVPASDSHSGSEFRRWS